LLSNLSPYPFKERGIKGVRFIKKQRPQSYQIDKLEDCKLGSLVVPALIAFLHQQTYIPGEKLEREVVGAFGEGF